MKKALIIRILAALMFAQSTVAVAAPDKVRLQLKWFHQFQFAGYYMALEKGFYREAGLDVQLLEGGPTEQTTQPNSQDQLTVKRLLAGQADFSIASSGAILEYAAGKPIVALAAIFQNSPSVLLSLADSGIHTPLDFTAKRLTLSENAETLALLHKEGIDLNKLNIRYKNNQASVADLLDGNTDILFGYAGNEDYALKQKGANYQSIYPRDYGINFYNDVLITSQYLLQHHPAKVAGFVHASLRGWEYALTHKNETCRLIQQRYTPHKSLDELSFEADELYKLIMPGLVPLGHMNPGRWRHIGETYAELGMMPANFTLTNFLYDPNPPPPNLTWLYLLLSVGLLAGLGISAVSIYILRINRRQTKSLSILEATLESTAEAILVVSLDSKIQAYNQQFLALWGINNDIVSCMDDPPVLAYAANQVKDPAGFLQKVHALYKTPETESFDLIEFKDGRTIERHSLPQRLMGKVIGRVWSFRDITARKANELELLESRRSYADIIESALDAIISLNAEQRIILFSPGAEQMFGCAADAAIGKAVDEFIPPAYRAAHRRHIENFGRSATANARMGDLRRVSGLRANGEEFPIEASISQSLLDGKKTYTAIIRDISERVRVEKQLLASRQENQLLAELIQISTQPIGVGSSDGRIYLTNKAFADMLDYSMPELYEINWASQLTAPEWREFEQAKLAELWETGQAVRYEKEYIRKDGVRIPVELLVNCKRDSSGKLELFYAFVTDISERKQVEAKIRESEQHILLATEVTGVGIWQWHLDTNLVHWDAQMFRIYGIPPTADGFVPYSVWREAVLPEQLPEQEAIIQDTIRSLGLSTLEFQIIRADDGQRRYIKAVETVSLNAAGAVVAMVGTNLDITEHTLAEQSLRNSEERWRFGLEMANMGAWEMNIDKSNLWRSLRHAQIFGYSELPAEWSFEIFLQHVLPEDREQVQAIHKQAISQHQDWSFECRIRRIDGQVRWIWVKAKHLLLADGNYGRIFGLVSDITERKEAEQALRDADQHKDNFLAMLAHELRNPLAPISNALEIQKLNYADAERVRWSTDIIDRQLKQLTVQVNDLLDVSRISRDLIVLKKTTIEIRDFINPAIDACQPLLNAKRQTFKLQLPTEPVWLTGEAVRLAQVVSNLLNNAIKFSPENSVIELIIETDASDIRIRVIDHGCGIAAADLPNLFQLFYQADRKLDRAEGGLGIGLSIVHRLVEKHGGQIQAFSNGLNQGSEFVVRLPHLAAAAVLPAAPIATPAASAPTAKLRILLVDDNHDVADSMAMLLTLAGHQVQTAHDGLRGLEMACAERPDVIILDIGLPGMDGYALAQALREHQELAQTLLIAMTGYGRPEDKQKALTAGCNEFMVKPPDIKQLRQILTDFQTGRQGAA